MTTPRSSTAKGKRLYLRPATCTGRLKKSVAWAMAKAVKRSWMSRLPIR